jgi:peroxiredoxin
MRKLAPLLVLIAAFCLPLAMPAAAGPRGHGRAAHRRARHAPNFHLLDRAGKAHSLAAFRGRSITLFFMCGCAQCTALARQWSEWQRAGVLPGAGQGTIVIFAGEAQYAEGLISASGIDTARTLVVGDPDLHVTRALYHAPTCPRVFVVDPHGLIRYTNSHADDAPQKAPAELIASRALAALRKCRSK